MACSLPRPSSCFRTGDIARFVVETSTSYFTVSFNYTSNEAPSFVKLPDIATGRTYRQGRGTPDIPRFLGHKHIVSLKASSRVRGQISMLSFTSTPNEMTPNHPKKPVRRFTVPYIPALQNPQIDEDTGRLVYFVQPGMRHDHMRIVVLDFATVLGH